MAVEKSLSEIVEEHLAEGKVDLPVFDDTCARIQQLLSGPDFDLGAVQELVTSDPALTSAVLRHANSSFFGGIEKVVTVHDAIVRLGVKRVSEVVLLASQAQQYQLKDATLQSFARDLWRHAVACGIGSEWLGRKLELGEQLEHAFLGGLLHDIGKLLLLRVLDDLCQTRPGFEPSTELVSQLLDGLHCEQGHALMQTWNIPEIYAGIVRDHHAEEYDERDLMLGVIRLVDAAANQLGIGVRERVESNLAASAEAQALRVPEVALAELEIRLEDAMALAE